MPAAVPVVEGQQKSAIQTPTVSDANGQHVHDAPSAAQMYEQQVQNVPTLTATLNSSVEIIMTQIATDTVKKMWFRVQAQPCAATL